VRVSSLRRASLVDEVAQRLQELIEREGRTAGDRLATEAELIADLQVSRTVLREAVQRLETIGLITVRRGQGMFVGNPESLSACVKLVRTAMAIAPRDLVQFLEFRAAVESYVAREAARRATSQQLAELEDLCERMDHNEQPYDEAIRVDFEFHRKLMEIAGNELTLRVMTVLQEFFLAGMARTTPNPRDPLLSRRLHRAILQAVRRGDASRAEAAMRRHMEITRARLAACLAATEQGGAEP
jgi:GntR family transcriptional repressor for pyruvate dehydrogenase complex